LYHAPGTAAGERRAASAGLSAVMVSSSPGFIVILFTGISALLKKDGDNHG
jgi:hypothetical protein